MLQIVEMVRQHVDQIARVTDEPDVRAGEQVEQSSRAEADLGHVCRDLSGLSQVVADECLLLRRSPVRQRSEFGGEATQGQHLDRVPAHLGPPPGWAVE